MSLWFKERKKKFKTWQTVHRSLFILFWSECTIQHRETREGESEPNFIMHSQMQESERERGACRRTVGPRGNREKKREGPSFFEPEGARGRKRDKGIAGGVVGHFFRQYRRGEVWGATKTSHTGFFLAIFGLNGAGSFSGEQQHRRGGACASIFFVFWVTQSVC